MKNKRLAILVFVFFIIINTNYFWEGKLGVFAFPVFIFFAFVFLMFLVLFFFQLNLAIRERFKDKTRVITIGIMVILMILIILRPNGLIDFDRFNGDDLLIAQREGAANCMITLILKENKTFRQRSVCFGVTEINGEYDLKNDTIFFKNVKYRNNDKKYHKYAVFKPSKDYMKKDKFDLIIFDNQDDLEGIRLLIIKNDFNK